MKLLLSDGIPLPSLYSNYPYGVIDLDTKISCWVWNYHSPFYITAQETNLPQQVVIQMAVQDLVVFHRPEVLW